MCPPDPLVSPSHLLGTSPSMSTEHRVLSLNSPQFKIGRSKEVDLCLMDVNISRLQCVISWCQDSQQWSVTDHSSNGVWVGGVRTTKGFPTTLNQGDIIVLSDLKHLYSWRFGMGKVDAEEIDDQEEPMTKKRKTLVVDEISEVSNGNNKVLSQHEGTSELKMLKKKNILENAVKVGQQKQEALMGERDILLARLEDNTKMQSKKEREAREKLEKEMEGKEEREENLKQIEKLMKIEKEQQDQKLKRLIEEMDLKVKCEEQKRMKEIEARDHLVATLSAEKGGMEDQLEKERDAMENELKVLQKQLEEENSSMKKREIEWNKRLSSMNSENEDKVFKERENMEAAVLREKQEKERLAREVEEQIQKRETEVKQQEDVLLMERSKHAVQLKMMEEEKAHREIEMKRRNEELEKRKEEQRQLEEEMSKIIQEMERKREEMAKEIEAARLSKGVTEEESLARAARITNLEHEKDVVVRELSGVRGKEEDKADLLTKMEETLEKQYQCPTCLELLISPVALNCGHTYCWLCLAQWKGSSGRTRGDLGTCPQCRKSVLHENRVFAIDQMIDAMVDQLGEVKSQERATKLRERKAAEGQFKATATAAAANTANRSRAAPGVGEGQAAAAAEALRNRMAYTAHRARTQAAAEAEALRMADMARMQADARRRTNMARMQAPPPVRPAHTPESDLRLVSQVERSYLSRVAEQNGFSKMCDQQYMVQFKNRDKTVAVNVYTTKGTIMLQGGRGVRAETKKNCSVADFVGLLRKVTTSEHQFVSSIHQNSDHVRNISDPARTVSDL